MTNIERFISDLKETCRSNDINLYLPQTKTLKIGIHPVSGYFDSTTLACAMNRKDYVETLIHESCHMDQYLLDKELWSKIDKYGDIDDWFSGKELNQVDKALDAIKWLELDCEKRSVKKLKKYGIPFNQKQYIQKANAYVQFYNFLWYSRRWCTKKNTPYSNKAIWSEMPDTFMPKSWYQNIGDYELSVFIRSRI